MDLKTQKQGAMVQWRWNNELTQEQREKLLEEHEGRLMRLFTKLGLTGVCNDCGCIFHTYEFDEGPDGFACPECHSTDVLDGSNPLNYVPEDEREDR